MYSSSTVYRKSFHIALFDRGCRLWYATSLACGAAAFTWRRAAWTVGRTAGGIFRRWSDAVITRALSIITCEQAAHHFPARSRMGRNFGSDAASTRPEPRGCDHNVRFGTFTAH